MEITILKSVSFVFTVRGEFYGKSSELTYTSLILTYVSHQEYILFFLIVMICHQNYNWVVEQRKWKSILIMLIKTTLHAIERRLMHRIKKRDIKNCLAFGIKEPSIKGRWKYSYNEVVLIMDPTGTREITTFMKKKKKKAQKRRWLGINYSKVLLITQ